MAKVKLVRRGNPAKPEKGKKWYGLSVSSAPLSARQLARYATENTSLNPLELEMALELFGNCAVRQLLLGHAVRIGHLGHLRLTFKSEGVDDIRDYHPSRHVRQPRILFTPSKELHERVVKNLSFELGPVTEDGITYGSVAGYLKAKGLAEAAPTE